MFFSDEMEMILALKKCIGDTFQWNGKVDCGNDSKSTNNLLVSSSSNLRFQHSMLCIWYIQIELIQSSRFCRLSPELYHKVTKPMSIYTFQTVKSTVNSESDYLFRCFSVSLSSVCFMWSFNVDSISNRSGKLSCLFAI